jgi:DNA modification methylase
MSSSEFIDFQCSIFRHLVHHSVDGSIHYQFMSWHHAFEMLSAGREEYTELKNILVWNKTNASRGFYRSQHELIFVFKSGTADHICTFGIEKGVRWRSNVLTYPGCNTFRNGRDEDLAAHPTVKNLSLIADLLRDCSKRAGIILDPFGGSGTTLLAAEMTRRRGRLIEIDPAYVDVTIRRWEQKTGREAVLEATGQTFAAVADERSGALGVE